MADDELASRRTLAERLNHLFNTIHPRDRGEYSFEEVADAIRARGGPTISATYLWQLRKGLRDNPTKKHLEALADFFGVSPAYFFNEEAAARIDAELELLAALRDASVRQIALRASGLSPQSLSTIAEMIERVRQLERLPDANGHMQTRRRRPYRQNERSS
ncbi:MAG: XRE family transcriptional regulator [Dehalococcoidia bacterium]